MCSALAGPGLVRGGGGGSGCWELSRDERWIKKSLLRFALSALPCWTLKQCLSKSGWRRILGFAGGLKWIPELSGYMRGWDIVSHWWLYSLVVIWTWWSGGCSCSPDNQTKAMSCYHIWKRKWFWLWESDVGNPLDTWLWCTVSVHTAGGGGGVCLSLQCNHKHKQWHTEAGDPDQISWPRIWLTDSNTCSY